MPLCYVAALSKDLGPRSAILSRSTKINGRVLYQEEGGASRRNSPDSSTADTHSGGYDDAPGGAKFDACAQTHKIAASGEYDILGKYPPKWMLKPATTFLTL